jgi:hypothetical protein
MRRKQWVTERVDWPRRDVTHVYSPNHCWGSLIEFLAEAPRSLKLCAGGRRGDCAAGLLVNVLTGIYGFARVPRKTVTFAPVTAGNEYV